jgi:hypothetical protein
MKLVLMYNYVCITNTRDGKCAFNVYFNHHLWISDIEQMTIKRENEVLMLGEGIGSNFLVNIFISYNVYVRFLVTL